MLGAPWIVGSTILRVLCHLSLRYSLLKMLGSMLLHGHLDCVNPGTVMHGIADRFFAQILRHTQSNQITVRNGM